MSKVLYDFWLCGKRTSNIDKNFVFLEIFHCGNLAIASLKKKEIFNLVQSFKNAAILWVNCTSSSIINKNFQMRYELEEKI